MKAQGSGMPCRALDHLEETCCLRSKPSPKLQDSLVVSSALAGKGGDRGWSGMPPFFTQIGGGLFGRNYINCFCFMTFYSTLP